MSSLRKAVLLALGRDHSQARIRHLEGVIHQVRAIWETGHPVQTCPCVACLMYDATLERPAEDL